MNSKADVNRRVLAIQAKKKRHKNNKKRGKQNGNASQEQSSHPNPNQSPNLNRSSENLQAPDNANNSHAEMPLTGSAAASFSKATAVTASTSSGSTPEQYQQQGTAGKSKNNQQKDQQHQQQQKEQHNKEHLQQPPRSSSNDSYESDLNSENEEQELKEDYCKGGYHPVNIGDLFQGKAPVCTSLFQSVFHVPPSAPPQFPALFIS